ncbi:DUF5694 domain-containing protein [Luteimonas terrae]|uniref:DUF4932 domain-containing protein n=1 Tax=Luteimonas terrae TaxID=1530191 RepID=A0ABU1Y0T7_9GAMM|nr:DUF5694 domain-containing protein [Luteimonas terrae]MDR7194639.1 hypothetical protein [Luteimonas terrae]
MSFPRALIAAVLTLFAAVSAVATPVEPPASGKPITILLLGTHHLHNPGQDLVNIDTDDVLSPARQRELEALGDALLGFRPDKVAVEARVSTPDLAIPGRLDPDALASDRNEITQIAQRVAIKAGLERMYGVDVDGRFDLGPLRAITAEPGAGHMRQALAHATELGTVMAERVNTLSIPAYMAWLNSDAMIEANHGFYRTLVRVSDGTRFPGADLVSDWYARNARICARILQVAEPGERILVLYGVGHVHWLRDCLGTLPDVELVHPAPYLEAAEQMLSTSAAPVDASASIRYEVGVHPGTELLHVINYLARVYGPPVKDYDYRRAVDAWFGHLREHPAVVHARTLPYNDFVELGWAFEWPGPVLVPPEGFAHLTPIKGEEWLHEYLRLAADFAVASDFAGFFEAHQPDYARWTEQFRTRLAQVDPLTELADFYGSGLDKTLYFSISPLGVVLKANIVIDEVAPRHAHYGPILIPFDPRFLAEGDTDAARFDYLDEPLANAVWHEATHIALEQFASGQRDVLLDIRYADAFSRQFELFDDPRLNTYFFVHEVLSDAVAIALKGQRFGAASAETHLELNEAMGGTLYRPVVEHLQRAYVPHRAQRDFRAHLPALAAFISRTGDALPADPQPQTD